MKLFALLLTAAAFLQTTIIPLNLCLILVICRVLVTNDRANLYLAFAIGLLLSLLSSKNLGFYPLIFLLDTKLVGIIRRYLTSPHIVIVIAIAALPLFLSSQIEAFVFTEKINFSKIALETILALPAYTFIKLWEERFVAKGSIKLKIKR